ncbi:MAG: HEPN domain-containing protein, partial [Anaerolineaceae bacterium]|nr:HEPN domain-containing protein [Anaerolineaceae bacterium]
MNPLLEEARAWLRKARSDLLSARILVEHSPLVLGPAAFHCQQAAEKTLKAFLISRSVPFERVHSL